MPNYSVNTSTLNLVVEDRDFLYRDLGQDVVFSRTWNADPSEKGMFGKGWGFSYESTIRLYGSFNGAAERIKGSGKVASYRYSAHTTDGNNNVTSTFTPDAMNLFDSLTGYFSAGSSHFILKEKDSNLSFRYDYKEKEPSGADVYRLASITDRNGNAVRIVYNTDGTIASVTDSAGRQTTFTYDANKYCTAMTVPDGRGATYTYDADGSMVRNTDLLGTAITYEYDANGYMTSMSFGNRTTRFAYDTSGGWKHISAVIDANGSTRQYYANSPGSTTVTDPLGTVTSYNNDKGLTWLRSIPSIGNSGRTFQNGLPVSITDWNGKTTSFEYDGKGNVTRVAGTTTGYDDNGNQVVNSTAYASYTYDAESNLTGVTDALGKTGTFFYDTKGNLVRSVSPMDKEKIYTWDSRGLLTGFRDEKSRTSSFTYDSFGNLKNVTNSAGKTTALAYDAFGFSMVSMTDPLGRITQLSYDNNGRITKITNPDSSFRTSTYDACSATSATDEKGNTTVYERNGLSAITRIIDPAGKPTSIGYDGKGNMVSVTNALGQTTRTAYDAAGRGREVRRPSGDTLTVSLDPNGNLLSLIDERSKETAFTYDARNRAISIQDPLGNRILYTRDTLGRVTGRTNPDGSSITYAYDDDGYLTGKIYSAGGSITFGRDDAGNVTSVSDATGTTAFTYNNLDQVSSITYPDNLSLSFTYDDAGNRSSVTYPGGLTVSYTYDNRNRVSSVSWGTGNSLAYTYDSAGYITKEERSNGTESSYAYDANGRVVGISHKKGSHIFVDLGYKRDALGNTTEETQSLPISHNPADLSVSATYNDGNQIAAWGSDSYTYDPKGNATSAGNASMAAVYDVENRPLSITRNGTTTTCTYNGLGWRTKTMSGTGTRNFHHDSSGKLMCETGGGGNSSALYI